MSFAVEKYASSSKQVDIKRIEITYQLLNEAILHRTMRQSKQHIHHMSSISHDATQMDQGDAFHLVISSSPPIMVVYRCQKTKYF